MLYYWCFPLLQSLAFPLVNRAHHSQSDKGGGTRKLHRFRRQARDNSQEFTRGALWTKGWVWKECDQREPQETESDRQGSLRQSCWSKRKTMWNPVRGGRASELSWTVVTFELSLTSSIRGLKVGHPQRSCSPWVFLTRLSSWNAGTALVPQSQVAGLLLGLFMRDSSKLNGLGQS